MDKNKNATPNLAVRVAGVEFKNPVIAASGTFGFGREYGKLFDLSVLGGISTKGLTLNPREGNAGARIAETASGILNSVGLQNPGIDAFLRDELPDLQKAGTKVIANIAGFSEDEYCALAEKLHTAVDMIELNISCPNVKAGGMSFGVYPDSVHKIVKAVKRHCACPLMVKLSPNCADIAENARAAEEGGADALSLINTLGGMAVDYRTRKPVLGNVFGGLSGRAVKPVALKMVRQAYNAVKIPVVGLGGIASAGDVLEFMLCGARAVQIGTAQISDPFALVRAVNDLTNLLKDCNIEDINEIVGKLET
ncbi:MAG: dihydroorotate dehydrogenase [Clostridiales bacterium]|jgi:dihydroorotate dehydrogenase (NAD+) catalytic subunit|nr:dihydroorotate dehydrogenase [Clostridiales bacterium]